MIYFLLQLHLDVLKPLLTVYNLLSALLQYVNAAQLYQTS